jgi:hypothetical protein
MKCKEAYVCLLNAPRADALPPELIQHLYRCAKCRNRQARLLSLEQEVRAMPGPVESPDARTSILARLEPRPLMPVVEPITGQMLAPPVDFATALLNTWRGKAAIFGTAAAILLVFGLAMGWAVSSLLHPDAGTPLAVNPPAPPAPAPSGPTDSVVGRVLEKHLALAETSRPGDQVTLLADIASDLRTEALRLAKEGPVEDVLLVSSLYERVVCQGVVGRAKTMPAEQQAALTAQLASQLERTAVESEQAAASALPGAGEGLRNLASAARAASLSLSGQAAAPQLRSPSWEPSRSGTMRDLLGVVVLQGIQLAEEPDPLRRAEHCNDVAEHLVQGILLASSGGDSDRAAKLGGFLGNVMDRGVASNLDRYQPVGPQDVRMAEAERIEERSSKAVETLFANLEKAPEAAQPALQKALEASKSKPGKGKKGKGLPPGLQKALEQSKGK